MHFEVDQIYLLTNRRKTSTSYIYKYIVVWILTKDDKTIIQQFVRAPGANRITWTKI